jgi:hypothetical protein
LELARPKPDNARNWSLFKGNVAAAPNLTTQETGRYFKGNAAAAPNLTTQETGRYLKEM